MSIVVVVEVLVIAVVGVAIIVVFGVSLPQGRHSGQGLHRVWKNPINFGFVDIDIMFR